MAPALQSTPAADGFWMPGEFEPHERCWMAWPTRPDNWRDDARPAQEAFAAVAAAVAAAEPVKMAAAPAQVERAREMLPDGVEVVAIESDDAWMRDIGPSFVVDGEGGRRGVDWRFNAWGGERGGLYKSWDRDEAVAAAVLEEEGDDRYRAPIVLEGGSIHVDGEGTVLCTEECLLNPNRNPGLPRAEIEATLLRYLGARKVIWLGRGVYRDETDGHVDNLACFARPGLVLLSWCDDEDDPQHAISVDALRRLETCTDARGRHLQVVRIPSPGPLHTTAEEAAGVVPAPGTAPRRPGDRLAASYVNSYVANGRVVMPLLDERCDERAAAVLAECFPGREVVGVPAREILLGGGNVHCITQQVPVAGSGGPAPGAPPRA